MEKLEFEFSGGVALAARNRPILSGVLGSGNLEVLVEACDLSGKTRVEVETAAVGFGTIWQAVLSDVFDRWKIGDVKVSINDAGATPAVVALRLDQALQAYSGKSGEARS
ncbi:malonate decarboxylase acyl carrier protein [Agrobacterium rubi]|uniref:malonate decarboxylase acyl carrier protein n=1 Tax=Agrobacterium rubi TaxID=28099 RepID=UPI00157465AC|nr:malonate decarboxylase acyl carrier protein [Agrobacterium rubi]NTF09664.1 malonate decarboxylase acyl carrier protein [Agrobacterium rubi]NTF22571.1 malonate decarboxylase acyl carrier protein [Agrobacterium rubi]NTF29428.1 malonate decarboxylase acyl carrier protein [Agrobacterium rubi]